MPSSRKRDVHGIVLLDKPSGLSSNQALQTVKDLFQARKAGHVGSLDPLATGLLPICLGEATKIAGWLLGSNKAYAAECLLGVCTDTDDTEGEVIQRQAVPALSDEAIRRVMARFIGVIEQVPPVFSALKRDGIPMYVRARRGEMVQLEPRPVHIHALDWLDRDGAHLRFRVECGSGTYVRSLVRDLGDALECGAHLVSLRRLWVDPFKQPAMHTLEALQTLAEQSLASVDAALLPVDAGLTAMPAWGLDAAQSTAVARGQRILMAGDRAGPCRAYAEDGRLLALVERDIDGRLRVLRGFNLGPRDRQ